MSEKKCLVGFGPLCLSVSYSCLNFKIAGWATPHQNEFGVEGGCNVVCVFKFLDWGIQFGLLN